MKQKLMNMKNKAKKWWNENGKVVVVGAGCLVGGLVLGYLKGSYISDEKEMEIEGEVIDDIIDEIEDHGWIQVTAYGGSGRPMVLREG